VENQRVGSVCDRVLSGSLLGDPRSQGPGQRDELTDMAEGEGGEIIPINIENEMRTAYIDYSMSVIVSRALPDVRDG
jgi:hypothetical protein